MSYLDTGIYTIPAAARLVGVSEAKIRGWISGYHHSRAAPIVVNELGRLGRTVALSFKNLVEAIFIKGFADKGVPVRAIREMAVHAREMLNDEHPFATEVIFKTDKRAIFAELLDKALGDKRLYDLKTKNWAIEEIIRPFLVGAVVYGPRYANAWHPRFDLAPNVIVMPSVAFGQPTIRRVPTRALSDAVRAEGGDIETVARWYKLDIKDVQEAHRFQTSFARH